MLSKIKHIKRGNKMKTKTWSILLVIALAFCAKTYSQQMPGMQHSEMDMKATQTSEVTKAIAILWSAPTSKVQGAVMFEKVENGVKITADIFGLTPGKHGFHIHEFGDCSAVDYTSAGPHFMMTGQSHGAPGDKMSHMGDMGNLVADSTGKAHLEFVDANISFSGHNSILGRSVIIHEKEDDLKTQPTGNSGARIACGTIGIVKP
jgi:superoxide dismutase, Cu-Zn family